MTTENPSARFLTPQWKPQQIMSPHPHTPAERSFAFFLHALRMLWKCLVWNLSSPNVSWQSKVQLRALGLKVLLCRGSLSRTLMSREFFLCFFSWFNLQSKKSTYFLIWNLVDLPKGAQLHTPLTDSFPWGWQRQWPALLCLWLAAAEISRTFLHSLGRKKNLDGCTRACLAAVTCFLMNFCFGPQQNSRSLPCIRQVLFIPFFCFPTHFSSFNCRKSQWW